MTADRFMPNHTQLRKFQLNANSAGSYEQAAVGKGLILHSLCQAALKLPFGTREE